MKVKIEVERKRVICTKSIDNLKVGDVMDISGHFYTTYSWGKTTYHIELLKDDIEYNFTLSTIEKYFDEYTEH